MGGHLLSTVNPEAAALIQPEPAALKLPDCGDMVIYHMRQGYARQGRTRFPAFVQSRGGLPGTLNVTVIIDAGDLADEQMISQIGVGQEFHCWEWPDDSRNGGSPGTVASLHQRIGDLETENKALRDCVLGDFEVPGVSIIHIMQDFENRLRLASQEIQSVRDHTLSEPASGAPRVAKKSKAKSKKK